MLIKIVQNGFIVRSTVVPPAPGLKDYATNVFNHPQALAEFVEQWGRDNLPFELSKTEVLKDIVCDKIDNSPPVMLTKCTIFTGGKGDKVVKAVKIAKMRGTYKTINSGTYEDNIKFETILCVQFDTIIIDQFHMKLFDQFYMKFIEPISLEINIKNEPVQHIKLPNFILCTSDIIPLKLQHDERIFTVTSLNEDSICETDN